MYAFFRSVTFPLMSLLLLIFGNTFFLTFLAIHMEAQGESPVILGALSGSYFLGFILGAFIIEKLIDTVGHIRSFAAFAALAAALVLLMGLIPSIWLWMIIRLFQGICIAGVYVVIESWLLVLAGPKQTGRALAVYMIGLYGAQVISQQPLSMFDFNSLTPFCFTALLAALSVIPVCMKKVDCPKVSETSTLSIKKTYQASALGYITCICSGVALGMVYGVLPFFYRQKNFSLDQVELLMGAVYFGALTLQWPLGYLSDFFDRRIILILAIFSSFFASLFHLLFLDSTPFPLLILSTYILGGLIFSLYPLGMSQLCDHVDKKDIVGAMAALLLAYGVGSFFGPSTASLFMAYFPDQGFFLFMTLCLAFLCIVALFRLTQRGSLPQAEQGEHLILPQTSLHVVEMSDALEDYKK